MTSYETMKRAVLALDDKKASDIQVIKVDDLTILADYFVIASTTNSTHVKSLVDEVEYTLKQDNILPKNLEGYQYGNWVVMDYHDVVVHVFHEETREFYSLERLWSDGHPIDVKALIEEK